MNDPPGDRDQDFDNFVVNTQDRLIRLADLLTGDRGRAEDFVQHALIKVYLAWPRLRDGNPEAYCRTVITHAHIDWWRRRIWREQPITASYEPRVLADPAGDLDRRDAVLRALGDLMA